MRPGTSGETTPVRTFARKKPARKPFPAHRPRERVILPDPTACACCGSTRLAKLGEDVTETLEVVPRQWKVVQTVREKFTCRDCERISQPPAPFHVLPRGFAGPSLLAMSLFEKYGQHQPLNRQAERYAREGIDLSLSTLADQVGSCAVVLRPLYGLICTHVFAGERVHGDDTPVSVLAKGKTATGRAWVYVRDDRPFGGRARAPPAAVFFYSRPRRRAPGAPPARLRRHPSGRCLCGGRGGTRGASSSCSPTSPPKLGAAGCLGRAAGARSGEAHRRDLRCRTRDQWPSGRRALRGSHGARSAARRRPRSVDANRALEAVAARRSRQGDGTLSRVSSMMVASALPTRRGCSQAPTAAASAPP
jgi:transposase